MTDGKASYNGKILDGDPWKALKVLLANYPQEHDPNLPPSQRGAAGFLAYDLNKTVEQMTPPAGGGEALPQAVLPFYDVVVSFDHRDQRCWIVSTGWPDEDLIRPNKLARRRAAEFAALLAGPKMPQIEFSCTVSECRSNFSRGDLLPRYGTLLT
ncbi:hypothetical protein [Bradyrhizobium sp. 193]|uniref:hypothetical protein n=1 Tax=Bradyrhizobium sp. 193 TaxID=2782661 RepID=UPI00321199F2